MPLRRKPRPDAARNRARILTAAREQITVHGSSVPMEQIATVAGVAVGTLYKHFPTKADLVTAVITASFEVIADDAEAALERAQRGSSAIDELTGFLTRLIDISAHDHAVKAAARILNAADPATSHIEERATTALDLLISAARQQGDLRADFTLDDLYLLFPTFPTDQSPAARARWLALLLTGLLTPGSDRRGAMAGAADARVTEYYENRATDH